MPLATGTPPRPTDADLAVLARDLEGASATEIIAAAHETHGDGLVLTTSMTDTVLLDLALRVTPDLEVVFLDTGFHFAETLATLRRAVARHRLRITVERPAADAADVWADGVEACCAARKVAPLERALEGRTAWLSGLRRADGPSRADTPVVERDRRGLVKYNPLVTWSDDDVARHIAEHELLVNPLIDQGYPSIGCWPCTEPATGDDDRSGRWQGTTKTECGLHR